MEKLTRNQIIDALTVECPSELETDVDAVVTAIRNDESRETILSMDELDDMPETYAWLKAVL